ncbi:hypothetical protein [Oricola sp.]|uniref:hypothetical protein n=1 Tax=Oricola sp. TaxID=1979950 RepID=UPI0025D01ACE|nr:hypothetical protein [Oricola sp.]MCI5075656.1 hypothetical protein [Oricola sp.]
MKSTSGTVEHWNGKASRARARVRECVFHCSNVPLSESHRVISELAGKVNGTGFVPVFQKRENTLKFNRLNKKGGEYGR